MLIIWRGLGILVPVILAIVFMFTGYLVDVAMKNPDYSKWHYWPKTLGVILAAIAIWFLGRYLNSKPGKVVIEKDTGKEFVLRKAHDLFYIKFEYWAFIILAFAAFGYFV